MCQSRSLGNIRFKLGRGHVYLFLILLQFNFLPSLVKHFTKHLEQVVDSNIFKPGGGGCGTVLSVTCNKTQTEETKECLKTFGDYCKPRIQKIAALLLSHGKNIIFC